MSKKIKLNIYPENDLKKKFLFGDFIFWCLKYVFSSGRHLTSKCCQLFSFLINWWILRSFSKYFCEFLYLFSHFTAECFSWCSQMRSVLVVLTTFNLLKMFLRPNSPNSLRFVHCCHCYRYCFGCCESQLYYSSLLERTFRSPICRWMFVFVQF